MHRTALSSHWKQNKENKFLNHKISHICRVHWRYLMNTSQWFLITRGIPHLRTKLFTSIPHKCALTFIVVNYLHLKCWIMKPRLLMVQKWNPQHFKLPVPLSFLAPLFRSLSNSLSWSHTLESWGGRFLMPFVSLNITCGRKGEWAWLCRKNYSRHQKKKKGQWQFIYSLLLCFFGVLLTNDQFTLFYLNKCLHVTFS